MMTASKIETLTATATSAFRPGLRNAAALALTGGEHSKMSPEDLALAITRLNDGRARGGKERSDVHRRGTFNPAHYSFFGWYYLSVKTQLEAAFVQSVSARVDEWLRSEEALDFRAVVYGDFGKCGVCGARFSAGEIWQHEESRDLVHVGLDCCEKYKMVSGTNWSALDDERERANKSRRARAKKAKQFAKVLATYPGLEDALKVDHYIVKDIAARFQASCWISERQVALVMKLAAEAAMPKAEKPVEVNVPAPIAADRQTVRGVVVSVKEYDSAYGTSVKMTVKITTDKGSWLCWGTVPSAAFMGARIDSRGYPVSRGDVVEFDARLEAGRDAHFALFKRPTNFVLCADTVEAV